MIEEHYKGGLSGPYQLLKHPNLGQDFIVDWLYCGPIYYDIAGDYENIDRFEKDHLESSGGESEVEPWEGMSVQTLAGARGFVQWRRKHSYKPNNTFGPLEYAWGLKVFYASCYLESDIERDVYLWTDGAYAIWLNGGRIENFENLCRAHLIKGLNHLMVKICPRRICQLRIRVTEPNGGAIEGVRVWLRRKPPEQMEAPSSNLRLGIISDIWVPLIKEQPTIDGVLGALWEKAANVGGFVLGDGRLTRHQTEVHIFHDQERLYFFFRCREPKVDRLKTQGKVWRDDHLDIYLDPTHGHEDFCHIMVNWMGEIFDRRRSNYGWDAKGIECKTRVEDDGWTAELFIPFSDLGVKPPQGGDVWGVEFSRMEKPSREGRSSWIGAGEDPLGFGQLIFGSPPIHVDALDIGDPYNRRGLVTFRVKNCDKKRKISVGLTIKRGEEEVYLQQEALTLLKGEDKVVKIPYYAYECGEYRLSLNMDDVTQNKKVYSATYPIVFGPSIRLEGADFKSGLLNENPIWETDLDRAAVAYACKECGRLEATFTLAKPPACDKILLLECRGEECRVKISVNDHEIFQQVLNDAPESGFIVRSILIPQAALKDKENRVVIENLERGGSLGLAPLFAVLSARIVETEKYQISGDGVYHTLRIDAERLIGGRYKEKIVGEYNGFSLKRRTTVVEVPESVSWASELAGARNDLRAFFILEREPWVGDDKRSHFVLNIVPLCLAWPWTRDKLESAESFVKIMKEEERDPLYSIEINGHQVNNVRKEGGINPVYFADLSLPIDPHILKKGMNELTIRPRTHLFFYKSRNDMCRFTHQPEYEIEYFTLRERVVRDLEIIVCPRCVDVGEDFYIKVEALKSHRLDGVDCGEALEFLGTLPLWLSPGRHKLWFRALKPAAYPKITIYAEGVTGSCCLKRIVDVPKGERIIFSAQYMVSSNPNRLDAHECELEGMKDIDLVNSLCMRARFGEDLTFDHIRKIADVWVRNKFYMWPSWQFFWGGRSYLSIVADYLKAEISGSSLKYAVDSWTLEKMPSLPSESELKAPLKGKVTENDLKVLLGKYFFLGGTTRLEMPCGPWKDVKEAKEAFIQILKAFYTLCPTFASHNNHLWHKYACEAGARAVWYQHGYGNSELVLSYLRGVSRAYKVPFGASDCDECSVTSTENPRYFNMTKLLAYSAYISGCDFLMPEYIQLLCMTGFLLSYNEGTVNGIDASIGMKRLALEKEVYDFVRTRRRLRGPVVYMGFVSGNLDGWPGWDGQTRGNPFKEGYFMPGGFLYAWGSQWGKIWENWVPGTPEAGWRYLDAAVPGIQFIMSYPLVYPTEKQSGHWFTATPYGKFDIVPIEAPLEVLKQYRTLVFLGWNTATEEQIRKLKEYVEGGGVLFMSLPHLSTQTQREADLEIIRGGDLRELFGVKVLGRGEEVRTIRWVRPHGDFDIPEGAVYEMKGHERNKIFRADVELEEATALAVDVESGKPVLMQKSLGKGRAYLLALWNYPGEEKLTDFVRNLVRSIASISQGPVRIRGSQDINFAVYVDDENVGMNSKVGDVLTAIYLMDIDWWTLNKEAEESVLSLRGHDFPLKVNQADLRIVTWHKKIAIAPLERMVYVEAIREKDEGRCYDVTIQGSDEQIFEILFLEGCPRSMKLNGQDIDYEFNAMKRMGRFKCSLRGKDVVSITLA